MLTIEQLKSLKVGDWVWIVYLPTGKGHYDFIEEHGEDSILMFDFGDKFAYRYSDYGYMWEAYKNKEEAEGKSITLPYLLCTSSKFACVIWRDTDGKVKKTYTMPIDEAKRVLKEKERLKNN